jgi:hypothetical protein
VIQGGGGSRSGLRQKNHPRDRCMCHFVTNIQESLVDHFEHSFASHFQQQFVTEPAQQ